MPLLVEPHHNSLGVHGVFGRLSLSGQCLSFHGQVRTELMWHFQVIMLVEL